MTAAIQLVGITKNFGPVAANKDINLTLEKGEILALLGENGSGKTTLMNMLSGIYKPDAGSIYVDGDPVQINSPEDSAKLGIGMVHQHFKLVERFTALENILIGMRDRRRVFLDRDVRGFVEQTAQKYGFTIELDKVVSNMAVSEKQTLEILKVLCYGARTIIFDEPTAVLTVQEIDHLFDAMRKMKENGHSLIIITHKLNEVMSISDRVAILRHGKYIDTVKTSETSENSLTELMVGRKVALNIDRPRMEKTKPLLEIRDLTVRSDEGGIAVDHVNFYIRGGEMLGVAGIAGSGQKELCEAIVGLRKVEEGKMLHKGTSIVNMSTKDIVDRGIVMSFIPEDRLGMGLSPSLSIADNMILETYDETPGPLVDRDRAHDLADKVIEALEISTPSADTPVRQLSGGNVQKVLLGREIEAHPNVLITAYPVRGLDINSSYVIYDILNQQKKDGVGILFVGEDLDVMLELCDKVMVLCHGELMGVVNCENATKEQIGLMMTGASNIVNAKEGKVGGIARDSVLDEMEAARAAWAAAGRRKKTSDASDTTDANAN